MNVEDTASFNNEPDLVLVMPVFPVESGQHGIETWSRSVHVDDIGGHIPTSSLEFFNVS
jgi:hypothetical protein